MFELFGVPSFAMSVVLYPIVFENRFMSKEEEALYEDTVVFKFYSLSFSWMSFVL